MNRRTFFAGLSVVPLTIGDKLRISNQRVPKRHKALLSPKSASVGTVTPMVRISAVGPSSVHLEAAVGSFSITGIVKTGQNVSITWQGGTGPFQVFHRPAMTGVWSAIGPYTIAQSVTFPDTNGFDTFRVQGYVGKASGAANPNDTAHLSWVLPAT